MIFTSVRKLEGGRCNKVLGGQTGGREPVPTEGERLRRIHVEDAVHDLQPLRAVHGLGLYAEAFEVVEHIRFDPLQPGLRGADAVRVDAKGEILGLDKAVVALGELVLEHGRVLGAERVEGVVLLRDGYAFRIRIDVVNIGLQLFHKGFA